MKFRKKPIVIEAEQFVVYPQTDGNKHQITVNGMLFPVRKDERGIYIEIPTMEGLMRASNLDWIIKGVNGEFYPCKPDIFEKTYEYASQSVNQGEGVERLYTKENIIKAIEFGFYQCQKHGSILIAEENDFIDSLKLTPNGK